MRKIVPTRSVQGSPACEQCFTSKSPILLLHYMKMMFLLFLPIVLLFSLCHPEVIDITTIYDTERPNEVECHARTNAMGLSFITPDGTFRDPDDVTNLPSCHVELDGPCPWEYVQWSQDEPKNHPTLPFLDPKYKKIWFLQESGGWLSSPPFQTTKATACLSFIYYMDFDCDCSLEVYAKVGGEVQQLLDVVQSGNYSKWQVRRVTLEMDEPSSIIFAIQGYKDNSSANVAVFAMMGCNSQGMDETALITIPSNLTDDFICQVANNIFQDSGITDENEECKKNCNNGGFCDPVSGSCICPPGFIGSQCELGCGENHFGVDCEGHCSGDLFGCRGRKLCSPYIPCMCAPGYQGNQCKDRCAPGNYGGDCLQMCGHCDSNTTCDVFSGLCPDGCSQGYYPPSCKQRYSFLLTPPDVTEIDYENATITFSVREENLGGTGHPQYYRVDYAVDGEWISESPKLLPVDSHNVQHLLGPLTAGKAYQVRVVLIDRDGSYYTINSEDLFANFTTPCQVPSNPFYLITPLWVQKTSFEVEWKYEPKVSGACPVENYAVYVEGELYITTNKTSVIVEDRIPYTTYNIWIQPLTVQGGLPISRPTRVVTPQGAPSAVVALTLTKGSPTALFLEWRPPNFKNGIIIHYLIKYQCLHYLACSEPCTESRGNITSATNNFVLTGLYPHSQYEVSVAAVTIEVGPYTSLLASTSPTEPEIAPEPSPVAVHNITSNTLTFNWTSVTDCKKLNGYPAGYLVSLYRIAKSGTNVLVSTNNVQRPPIQFQGLLPKQDYELHVRQLVSDNMFSKEYKLVIKGRTFSKHPPTVTNLQITFLSAHFIDIQWEFPVQEFPAMKFIISIECKEMLACPPPSDAYCTSPIDSFTNETSVRIAGLPPYAKYSIHISTFHKQHAASGAKLNVTTPMAVADTTPAMHPEPVKARGSTWAEVQWSPPEDCSLVHGELAAYGQRLLFQGTLLRETLTDPKTLSANFTMLMPSTKYGVEVFLVTGLENGTEHMFSERALQIMFTTLPRAPGPVTELVSFIHGFNSIALRFRLPDYPFGTIDSVTVRYQNLNISGKTGVKKMKIKKCQLWPNLICLQLEDLISRSQYKVTVSVWSSETKVEGEPSTITVITDKGVSGAPTGLQFVNRTDSSLTLKWNVPVILQGKLTAFSIDYIQTASVNSSWCCTNRTTLRIPVHKGEAYVKQITGLRPASSYNIEVRTVTKMSGPPVSMAEDTLPSKPSFKALPIPLPDTISDTSVEVWLPLPIPRPYSFISALFIAVHSRFDEPKSSEQKSEVANELATLIGPKAYIAMELEESDLLRSSRVIVGGGEEYFGRHGTFKNKKLMPSHFYRVELVVLSAYKKLRVYGRTMSKPFETKKSFGNFTIPPETDEI